MKNWDKTRIVLIIVSVIIILVSFFVQFYGVSQLQSACSYLDPWIIDLLAFLGGLFLVLEGGYRIFTHRNVSIKRQLTRILRIGLGFAILTLHMMQFLYK